MRTVTGVFARADDAWRAAERVREATSPRATVRVFLPSPSGVVIETSILRDNAGWLRVALLGVALGVLGSMFAFALGASLSVGLTGLLAGALGGVLIGIWLTGETYPRRILAGFGPLRFPYEKLVQEGRAIVTACVPTLNDAERAIEILEEEGGRAVEGFLHDNASQLGDLLPVE
jgi:hypothetical protein